MRTGIDARLVYYRPGGIAEYTRHVIQELALLDPASDYAVIHHRRQEALTPGPNFQRVNVYTPSHHRLEAWGLSVELARCRLDLLHSPDFIPPQYGARRHVITVHDLHFLHYPQFMTAASRRFYNDQITWAVKRADHILVDSQATRDDLSNLLNVPGDKMTVHMLGVNDRFHPLPDSVIAETSRALGTARIYILFVGTFEPRKNIPGLLEAYHILRQEIPGAPPLVMVGRRGWLYEEIFARVEALNLADNLIWLENTADADMPAIYNGAGVLVLPSHYEGFGLPALEAMACGTPAIVANRSSLPEVVGTVGLLVDPDDPAQIAASIQRILEDSALRELLRRDGPAHAAQFTWRRTAETVLSVYRALLH